MTSNNGFKYFFLLCIRKKKKKIQDGLRLEKNTVNQWIKYQYFLREEFGLRTITAPLRDFHNQEMDKVPVFPYRRIRLKNKC